MKRLSKLTVFTFLVLFCAGNLIGYSQSGDEDPPEVIILCSRPQSMQGRCFILQQDICVWSGYTEDYCIIL